MREVLPPAIEQKAWVKKTSICHSLYIAVAIPLSFEHTMASPAVDEKNAEKGLNPYQAGVHSGYDNDKDKLQGVTEDVVAVEA